MGDKKDVLLGFGIGRGSYTTLKAFDLETVNGLLREMATEAREIVAAGALGQPLQERRTAFMRYKGQGHEIEVTIPKAIYLHHLDFGFPFSASA